MSEITVEARLDNLDEVLRFLDAWLEEHDCSMKAQMQLDIAVEEMYVNIAHYAYVPETGNATIRLEETGEHSVKITLIDSGMPYNPLDKPDPDITLSAEERKIGGLGIYMVKKSMDAVDYRYENQCNIFSMTKAM